MFKIALCDDEQMFIDGIKNIIEEYFNIKSEICQISEFISGEELLKSTTEYDIIFIDIEVNGIAFGEEIRKKNMIVPIVYIIGSDRYIKNAYKIHPFGFVEKPVRSQEIYIILDDLLRAAYSVKKIMLMGADGEVLLRENEILYFIVNGRHKINVGTKSGEITVKGNLCEIMEKLDKTRFFICHRSCIINLEYVKKIVNKYDIIMADGSFCPLSQRKKTGLLKALDRYNYSGTMLLK